MAILARTQEKANGEWQREAIRNNDGSTAVIFAICLVPVLLTIGLAVDFGRRYDLQQKLQVAADSAALAATAILAQGGSTSSAEGEALNVWNVALASINTKQALVNAPSVSIANTGPLVSAEVKFSASQVTYFGRLAGVDSFALNGTSIAGAYQQTAAGTDLSGSGAVTADPDVKGADGNSFAMRCPAGNWYNVISDSGIEVNVTCSVIGGLGNYITGFAVIVGSNTIEFSIPSWDEDTGSPLNPWTPGLLKINGRDSIAPFQTITPLADGQATFAFFSTDYTDMSTNVLTVSTPQYLITMNYPNQEIKGGSGGMRPNGGSLQIKATGAGVCGTPGGYWGKTLVGIDDTTDHDFQVDDEFGTSSEFSRASCAEVYKDVRLMK